MPKVALRVISIGLALLLMSGCGPAIHGPYVLADAKGYRAKSPCGELITKVEVLRILEPGSFETYWVAQAHVESASDELTLFSPNAGYSSTPVTSTLLPGAQYDVIINDAEAGTSLIPRELSSGRGAWLSDNFDLANMAKEQKKVTSLLCHG